MSIRYNYIVEMLNVSKQFPGILALDNVTLQLKKGEIHALLGENGAGKSTLMSILFGLYQPDLGKIKVREKFVNINDPNDARKLGIGMVHQHFKLVHNLTVLENIILGVETTQGGLLKMDSAKDKVISLSEQYGLKIEPDAITESITVGMQQRVEILKMLYRENDILIFDEPTAVLTPQEISELMKIMTGLANEGKSIIFITHKLNEIKEVADRCTILRKGKLIQTVNVSDVSKEDLSEMMVGRKVDLNLVKGNLKSNDTILEIKNLTVKSDVHKKELVNKVSLSVRSGEIVCIAGIDGNGQSELVQAITGLIKPDFGTIRLCGKDITNETIRYRNTHGLGHIPEDRHKHGLVLDFPLSYNLVLQRYFEDSFCKNQVLNYSNIHKYGEKLIDKYDIRSGQGGDTITRNMSGGNQQKAIIAREIDRNPELLVAVQPTRGLDVGAIEYIHKQLIIERDKGKAILLISLELDEVMNLSDRILVIYEGTIVAELNPKTITTRELGLYMAGTNKKEEVS